MTQRKILSVHLNKYMAENNKKDKTPPKKKESKKKVQLPQTTSQIPPQTTPPANLSQPDPAVMKVIRDAMLVQLINPDSQIKKRQTANELDAMIATCEEFMKSFVILGYTFDGQPVAPIVIAHNQQEADALGSYLSKFIQNTIKEQNQDGI
jgi:hypothetical protein